MNTEQDTPEDSLAHYGVKGMRWGHRRPIGDDGLIKGSKSSDSSDSEGSSKSAKSSSSHHGMSDGQKKALKYAAGGAVVAGGVIAVAILAKNGKLPVGNLRGMNPNSLAAETKRMEQIPGTIAYKNKLARNPGSLAAETARMAKIPGTIANREATLASASKHAKTLTPENGAEYMRRVTAKLDRDAQMRSMALERRARLVAERAQRDARNAQMAARRQIVRNQAAAKKAADSEGDSGSSKIENAKTLMEAFSMGKDAVDTIRNSPGWNQPTSNLKATPSQRQQIVANQRRAKEAEEQNRSRAAK